MSIVWWNGTILSFREGFHYTFPLMDEEKRKMSCRLDWFLPYGGWCSTTLSTKHYSKNIVLLVWSNKTSKKLPQHLVAKIVSATEGGPQVNPWRDREINGE